MTMPDEQVEKVALAAGHLALTMRDEGLTGIAAAARAVLVAAGGDPIAALAVTAALIDTESPAKEWWLDIPQGPAIPDPPLAPDQRIDPVVVERLISGDHYVKSRPLERRAAVVALNHMSASMISERIGWPERTVTRHRAAARAALPP